VQKSLHHPQESQQALDEYGGLTAIKFDDLISSLHTDPRYKALLHKMNLSE
jgi:hypothetical protein